MAQSYKTLKENFVSGLSGGSTSEINYVTAVAPAAYLLWAALQARHAFFTPFNLPIILSDFLLNVMAILLVTTIYSSIPVLFNVLLLSIAAAIYLLPAKRKTLKKPSHLSRQTNDPVDGQLDPVPNRPFITAYRGGMMVITCLAILAVDFNIFPRRFAKVETWGTSLMDMGVGSFVFAAGLVSARPIVKASLVGEESSITRQLKASLRTSLPLLVLGLIRLYSVKGLDYAEHVTEYGVHWNFFFTLAFLPPFVALCQPLPTMIRCYVVPFLILAVYEICLDHTRLKAYILTASRNNLLSQNREGVFSFWGYLAIFLAGQAVGFDILPRTHTSTRSERTQLVKRLLTWFTVWFSLYCISTGTILGLRVHPSRRLANAPYVEWVVWFNCMQLLLYCLIETLLFPGVSTATDKDSEKRQVELANSRVLKAFNRNGLAIFLLANLLTGLVNLTLDTLHMGTVTSMVVLAFYAALVTAVALALDQWNISLKL